MSREIKFRAWDKKAKAYVGDRQLGFSLYEIALSPFEHADKLKELEFEQYTGLKDKNGKEICEGDIVKFGDSIAVIIWRDERTEFGVRWTDCGIEDSLSWQVDTEKTTSEVIGTIHENPELLGGEK